MKDRITDEQYELIFDPIEDLSERWGISLIDAEIFLERHGYFDAIEGGKIR